MHDADLSHVGLLTWSIYQRLEIIIRYECLKRNQTINLICNLIFCIELYFLYSLLKCSENLPMRSIGSENIEWLLIRGIKPRNFIETSYTTFNTIHLSKGRVCTFSSFSFFLATMLFTDAISLFLLSLLLFLPIYIFSSSFCLFWECNYSDPLLHACTLSFIWRDGTDGPHQMTRHLQDLVVELHFLK